MNAVEIEKATTALAGQAFEPAVSAPAQKASLKSMMRLQART